MNKSWNVHVFGEISQRGVIFGAPNLQKVTPPILLRGSGGGATLPALG
jgi:hypothetical protein